MLILSDVSVTNILVASLSRRKDANSQLERQFLYSFKVFDSLPD